MRATFSRRASTGTAAARCAARRPVVAGDRVAYGEPLAATVSRRAAQRAAAVPVETTSHAIYHPVSAKKWRAPGQRGSAYLGAENTMKL